MKRDPHTMKRDPHTEITHMHHKTRWIQPLETWVIINQDKEIVATVAAVTANHVTELTITLTPGLYTLAPRTVTRPGGTRTALRWVMTNLNNGKLWLSARLSLEHEARLLGYSESELLACEHATDYEYCLQLLINLSGLKSNLRYPDIEWGITIYDDWLEL